MEKGVLAGEQFAGGMGVIVITMGRQIKETQVKDLWNEHPKMFGKILEFPQ